MQHVELEDITWLCHVCKETRPDSMIGVLSFDVTPVGMAPRTIRQNVRHCNDREACVAGASKVRFIPSID